ncbi:MAG: hypothetical protein KJ706_05195 [Candidatus Omnitrophica bacterium]|nr:hypothetical protein [Candidatus Omnitrophota bacterium]
MAEDMDGKILLEAISEDYRKNNPIKSILTYENTTGKETRHQGPIPSPYDEIIKERLRSLGYIQ